MVILVRTFGNGPDNLFPMKESSTNRMVAHCEGIEPVRQFRLRSSCLRKRSLENSGGTMPDRFWDFRAMATIRQVELWLKEQSQVTELSNPFLPLTTRHFPSPLQGSTLKFQSFFPIFFSISFKAFTATVHASNLHQFTTNFSSKRIISHQIRSFSKEENGNCRGYFGNSSVPSSG